MSPRRLKVPKAPDAQAALIKKIGLTQLGTITSFELGELPVRAEQALRSTIVRMHIFERKTVRQIAQFLQLPDRLIEDRLPFLAEASKREIDPLRASFRDMQLEDIATAIDICRNIIKNKRVPTQTRMQAMDRMLKLYDRGAKSEGTDKHKDKLELSGGVSAGNLSPVDVSVMSEIIELSRRRHGADFPTIEIKALPSAQADEDE